MKRFINVILLLFLSVPLKTMAATIVIPETGDSSGWAVIFLTASLLILVVLVVWLLKSSYRLKEIINDVNTDGKNWLNSHLKDLDRQQVNILINRQHEVRNQPVNDKNQNEQ